MIQHIKAKLRAAGLTYKDLASRLDVSESTLKRWFSQGSFNIERLDDICQALGIDLVEMLPERKTKFVVRFLNEAQELELVADDGLLAVFYLMAGGRNVAEMVEHLVEVPLLKVRAYLLQLDRLGVMEFHPNDRIVPLVNQSVHWLPSGPLTAKYGQQIRHDFMNTSFFGENERSWLVSGLMSPASLQVFSRKLDVIMREFHDLLELDQDLAKHEVTNITFFAAHRPWRPPFMRGPKRPSSKE